MPEQMLDKEIIQMLVSVPIAVAFLFYVYVNNKQINNIVKGLEKLAEKLIDKIK